MEVLDLIRLFWGWVFPYISLTYTAYIGEASSILGTNEMFGENTTESRAKSHENCKILSSHRVRLALVSLYPN